MSQVYIVTDPELGWDCVVGVFSSLEAAIRCCLCRSGLEPNDWEKYAKKNERSHFDNGCIFIETIHFRIINMEDNKYYTIKSLTEYEFSEIDFDLYKGIFPDITSEEENEDGDGWYQQIGNYNRDGYPIEIDRLINKLQEFKTLGANYVSIEYHCDHIGYPLTALRIYQTPQEDIDENNRKEELKAEEKGILRPFTENKRNKERNLITPKASIV